ncbi:RsmB/NOP family class I SAM-dependent RNA methyltransferase [Ammonifex thiophilus]|uniref:SAM-dependent methyltransferase n=1 Tax=Ammonifex thiophilus TaxID=444093 RepID=A0A3D8P4G2_9THEO|nr:RsmB/NOP family class I SAM-dependent RNA methyltransferase [Ammonifex thiophilus]RDV82998.1 SAM-dependent methyltransferase [Ammonifex thiophilus]
MAGRWEDFLQRMARLLGEEVKPFAEALKRPEPPALRVNTLKLLPEHFAKRSPFPLDPVPWCPEGFVVLDARARPALHPYHVAGLYYLQDPAAMLAGVLLDPQPGEWVLDLCAAPGGKATHLAARMQNCGVLVANDPNPRRVTVLARNLERMGVTCAVVLQEEPARLAQRFAGLFDRVLVDAPCSGEATLAFDPEARRRWSPRTVCKMAALQSHILQHAARLIRPGGLLLYATCTFAPEENEEVIASFLRTHPEFHLVEVERHPLFDRGRPEWIHPYLPELARAVRLWPHRGPGKGHFYALLQREGEKASSHPHPGNSLPPEAAKAYRSFCERHLKGTPAEEGLILWREGIYRVPLPFKMLEGLRVLRPGWWLGIFKQGEFRPDHALALGMKTKQAKRVLSLLPSDPRLKAYLRGEEFPLDAEEGWVLIAVEEFPLGWGYCRQGKLRNFYPRAWRLPTSLS